MLQKCSPFFIIKFDILLKEQSLQVYAHISFFIKQGHTIRMSKQFCLLWLPAPYCETLITVIILSQNITVISQTQNISAVDFCIGYDKFKKKRKNGSFHGDHPCDVQIPRFLCLCFLKMVCRNLVSVLRSCGLVSKEHSKSVQFIRVLYHNVKQ